MGTKNKSGEKREKAKPESSSDSEPEEEEEEPVESERAKRKRESGRAAFFSLLRRPLAFIPLAMVLSRQPFMMRERSLGVNAAKMRPLDLAISGVTHWAARSPTTMRNPKLYVYTNLTSQALLTPHEYWIAQRSRAQRSKTAARAYEKAADAFTKIVDRDSNLREMATSPMPNVPLLGAYLLLTSVVLAPLSSGLFDYGIIVGCLLLLHGGRQLGMSQVMPELYVTGGIAALMIALMDGASSTTKPAPRRRKRR
jgi:hypothetical protein